ncbi:hypothetical protein GXB85_04645 [Cellulomonas sp. APG4]|uniref:hypothetical protein n=1 Tax=Cellulomonas sp. APG4 TaxID=1538656 RepID=UPI00137A99A5|nr:hypothetical protein [Cellulomonas sp. APG4]NCT90242.1 hypothetical protein [Cellulomonas sp. APG4]
MSPVPLRTILEEERRRMAVLCEALGIDPGVVVDVRWTATAPKKVTVTILDDPATGDRHDEQHDLPNPWPR